MTHIIIINGHPRAGKDTFIGFMEKHLRAHDIGCRSFSSIDPVRDMLGAYGFDLSQKTEADRKLLAVVGSAVEEHSNWRTEQCIAEALSAHIHTRGNTVVFLHIREPENIAKVRSWVEQEGSVLGISIATVFLRSDRSEKVKSNSADGGVGDMAYDHYVTNHGSLLDLDNTAAAFLRDIGVL